MQFVSLRAINRASRVRVPARVYLSAPTGLAGTESDTGGTLATGTYYYKVVALNATGVSLPSSEISKVVGSSVTTASVALTWTASSGATSYRIYRGTSAGAEDHYQTSATNSFTDTGSTGTAGTPPGTATGTTSGGLVELSTTTDTVVDLDDGPTRLALGHHQAIGQFLVSATNTTYGAAGSKSSLPSNA